MACSSVSTIRNQRYHIHANLSFAILVAEILLLISARFSPETVGPGSSVGDDSEGAEQEETLVTRTRMNFLLNQQSSDLSSHREAHRYRNIFSYLSESSYSASQPK